jgi:hypothetical protein
MVIAAAVSIAAATVTADTDVVVRPNLGFVLRPNLGVITR